MSAFVFSYFRYIYGRVRNQCDFLSKYIYLVQFDISEIDKTFKIISYPKS